MVSHISLLLHNIRSTHNVGSIFRTADAAGVEKLYLSGYTPAPIDRFGRARTDITKASLGAETSVKWESLEGAIGDKEEDQNSLDVVKDFLKKSKKEGKVVVALEQDPRSIDYRKLKQEIFGTTESKEEKSIVILLGAEVEGVEKDLLDLCDIIVEIPMLGEKESLNVSVATGIILYSLV